MTTPPLKPTRTFRQLLEEILSRLPEAPPQPTGPSLPLPATDAVPPPSHHDTDQEPTP